VPILETVVGKVHHTVGMYEIKEDGHQNVSSAVQMRSKCHQILKSRGNSESMDVMASEVIHRIP
jgi:hypothetical protein